MYKPPGSTAFTIAIIVAVASLIAIFAINHKLLPNQSTPSVFIPTPSPTPGALNPTQIANPQLDSALKSEQTQLGVVNSDSATIDTSINDKMGNLNE